jgi:hypothetical protein
MKATEIVNQIKEVLGIELSEEKIVLATMKLDNGTEIEAESFESGKEVFIVSEDNEKIALPVGDYTLEDGKLLAVKEEGLIDSIGEPEAEEEVVEEEVEAKTEEVEAEKEKEDMGYATKQELAEVKSMIEEIKAMIDKQDLSTEEDASVKSEETTTKVVYSSKEEKTEDVELAAETVEPIAHNPEALSSQKNNMQKQPKSHIDLIRQMIYNNK